MHDVGVNQCIHARNAIRTLHKETHKASGSHVAIYIQAKRPLCLTLHYLWTSSKGTHARLRAVDTDSLTEHLVFKFSPPFIGDIQRRFT